MKLIHFFPASKFAFTLDWGANMLSIWKDFFGANLDEIWTCPKWLAKTFMCNVVSKWPITARMKCFELFQ